MSRFLAGVRQVRTRKIACSTITNLIFTTSKLAKGLVTCNTIEELDSGFDHLPIITEVELNTIEEKSQLRGNWNKFNIEILRDELGTAISRSDIF